MQIPWQCFYDAGMYYGVKPAILEAIAKVESNYNPYAINVNRNKTVDYGIMQINSSWFPTLRRYGLYDYRNIYNPCYNIYVGAWILRKCINTYGNNWKAIGCYNAGSHASSHSAYAWKVYKAYKRLTYYAYQGW